MHFSKKRFILLHSPQNKTKKQNKNALSEKQKQVEVLFLD